MPYKFDFLDTLETITIKDIEFELDFENPKFNDEYNAFIDYCKEQEERGIETPNEVELTAKATNMLEALFGEQYKALTELGTLNSANITRLSTLVINIKTKRLKNLDAKAILDEFDI